MAIGVCNQCGLSQDLCVCEMIAREQQKIVVAIEKKKFGKEYTMVTGIEKGVNLNEIFRKLKMKFACGGTAKNDRIELQGNHRLRMKTALAELGFPEETIEVR